MQPISNTDGCFSLILDSTELFFPFMTLQLSLLNDTRLAHGILRLLKQKVVHKIPGHTSLSHVNLICSLNLALSTFTHLKVLSSTSNMAAAVPMLHTGISRNRVTALPRVPSARRTSITRFLSAPTSFDSSIKSENG